MHLAVALENDRHSQWPAFFIRKVEPGGAFMAGQNSCYTPGKLVVHPVGDMLFRADRAYAQIEVEWYPQWPRVAHTCDRHGRMSRPAIVQSFCDRLKTIMSIT